MWKSRKDKLIEELRRKLAAEEMELFRLRQLNTEVRLRYDSRYNFYVKHNKRYAETIFRAINNPRDVLHREVNYDVFSQAPGYLNALADNLNDGKNLRDLAEIIQELIVTAEGIKLVPIEAEPPTNAEKIPEGEDDSDDS